MQSDFFDNKVKAAADHHHPAYDEQAWKQMENLLDKHLPQKKEKKRRFLFFLLFAALIGGGGWLFVNQPWKPGDLVSTSQQEPPVTKTNSNAQPVQPVSSNGAPTVTTENKLTAEKDQDIISNEKEVAINNNQPTSNENFIVAPKQRPDPLTVAIQKSRAREKRNKTDRSVSEPQATTDAQLAGKFPGSVPAEENSIVTTNDLVVKSKPAVVDEKKNDNTTPLKSREKKDVVKTDDKKVEAPLSSTKTAKKKEKKKEPGSFFLSVSAGPDLSYAGENNWGDTRFLSGIGAGYTIRDRITIRTGFYSGRKVYSAKPGNYNPPPDFWTFYPYLQSVDADCKVYEIPVSVSYNFAKSKKQQWFASAGASAYVMKEESYDYYYKYDPSSPVYQKNYTIKNENSHLLSVVTLSGGYKRNLSQRIFVLAEPYMKIPVSGVGYGKVKLNSAGVMFTIGVKPFNAGSKSKTP